MTRIIYKIIDGWGESVGICGTGTPLILEVAAKSPSYVSIDGAVKLVSGGEAKFDLGAISDGEHTPTLSGSEHAVLEPLRVRGERVELLPTPDETVRRLLKRAARLEERLSAAEGDLSELRQKLNDKTIF